jgi:hypothetical protein
VFCVGVGRQVEDMSLVSGIHEHTNKLGRITRHTLYLYFFVGIEYGFYE